MDIVEPSYNGNPIIVYSRDNQFFSSILFSDPEVLTEHGTPTTPWNLLNRIEFHIYENGVIRINDNIDFALVNTETTQPNSRHRIFYLYHETENNIVNVCDLELTMSYKMKLFNPSIDLGPRFNTTDFVEGINYNSNPIDGVSAGQVYNDYDSNIGDIVIGPTNVPCNRPYGDKRYVRDLSETNKPKRVFMVKMVTNDGTGEIWDCVNNERVYRNELDAAYFPFRLESTDLNIDLRYAATVRLYANPILAAAVIGALIRYASLYENFNFIESQGFAYPDGTSYPSITHVNGLAFDLTYKGTMSLRGSLNLTEEEAIAEDEAFLSALHYYGFTRFLIGKSGSSSYGTSSNYINDLKNNVEGTSKDSKHEDHIHAYEFVAR